MGGRLILRSAPASTATVRALARDLADEGVLAKADVGVLRDWVRAVGGREAMTAAATVLGIDRMERDGGVLLAQARRPGRRLLLKSQGELFGKKGEGSRGGRVIGHTKSGKAIYDKFGHASHAGFSSADHGDAVEAHARAGKAGGGSSTEALKHSDAQHGEKIGSGREGIDEHNAATGARAKDQARKITGGKPNMAPAQKPDADPKEHWSRPHGTEREGAAQKLRTGAAYGTLAEHHGRKRVHAFGHGDKD